MLDDEMDAWLREEAGGCPERVILSYRRLVADVRQQKNEAIARLRDVEQKAAVDVERARADANRAIAAKHIARKLYNLERNLSRAWRGCCCSTSNAGTLTGPKDPGRTWSGATLR
jgi:hypothetical protein